MSVHKKLMQARLNLQATKLEKTGHNKFAGYKYFELGDFLPVIQKIFADLGLCGVVSFGESTATLTVTDTEDGTCLVITSPMSSAALKGCHEVQNLGAVQTYIRRYLWVTALEIVEHDALDATTGSGQAETRPARSVPQKQTIRPTDGMLESMSPEVQEYIRDLAADVTEAFKGGPDNALQRVEIENLDNDQKVALWGLLHSTVRSGIKKAQETAKKNQQQEPA